MYCSVMKATHMQARPPPINVILNKPTNINDVEDSDNGNTNIEAYTPGYLEPDLDCSDERSPS